MIAIVDYGLGNVRAFANIYKSLGVQHVIASDCSQIGAATHIVLPGVGAFDQAMRRFNASGMRDAVEHRVTDQGVPVLGVCVGLQMLMRNSEEGEEPGLGWIGGSVVRFDRDKGSRRLMVPHMGWNEVTPANDDGLFSGLDRRPRFYFLHSFHVRCDHDDDVLATADYGGDFHCAVRKGNINGVQFHPEKSHEAGLAVLRNFAAL